MTAFMRVLQFSLLLFYNSCFSQTFVNLNSIGLNNGTNWENAFTSLDTALLNCSYGEIWVSKGIYTPTRQNNTEDTSERNVSFYFKPNVSCFGGFAGNETQKSQRNVLLNPTILSGDIGEPNLKEDNCFHVIFNENEELDTNSSYDGFIITRGYFDGSYNNYKGAGICLQNAGTPVIRNCIIMENLGHSGGGIFYENTNPIIENNLIMNNQAFKGAGILKDLSTFSPSQTISGKIRNNKILFNHCMDYPNTSTTFHVGGGINISGYYDSEESIPRIEGNIIAYNSSKDEGGGMYIETSHNINVFDNYIIGNSSRYGGGMYLEYLTAIFINNLIVKNHAEDNGGGVYHNYYGNSKFINNTIALNTSASTGGIAIISSNTELINNIIYYNTGAYSNQVSIYTVNAGWQPKFSYCQIEGGLENMEIYNSSEDTTIYYENNILTPPLFLDTVSNDYQLNIESTGIDGGTIDTTDLNLPSFDFLKNSRIYNNQIDIGAIEYNAFFESFNSILNLDSINEIATSINLFIDLETSNLLANKLLYDPIKIIPNPFYDAATILSKELLKNATINIYNFNGKIESKIENVSGSNFVLSRKNLADGFYILQIVQDSKILSVKKLVVFTNN